MRQQWEGEEPPRACYDCNHLANNIPAASGASRFAVLVKLVLPPRMAKV